MTILFDPRDDQAHVQRKSNDRQLIQAAIASATSLFAFSKGHTYAGFLYVYVPEEAVYM